MKKKIFKYIQMFPNFNYGQDELESQNAKYFLLPASQK